MFALNIKMVVTTDPTLYVADHNRFLRNGFIAAAKYHHDQHIPQHFKPGAIERYGYKRRTSMANAGIFEAVGLFPWQPGERRNQPYQAFKDKLGLPPNVLSGALQQMTGLQYKITATSTKGSRLTMPTPQYAGGATGRIRPKRGQDQITTQQYNILARQAELEAITERELVQLAKVVDERYTNLANTPGIPRTFGP